jgi:hypothetical protein
MLVIDPNNPDHPVGASHFMYNIVAGGIFTGSVGAHISSDGGLTWNDHIVTGFDCATFHGAGGEKIYRNYDPTVAIDASGNFYTAMLPDNSLGGNTLLPCTSQNPPMAASRGPSQTVGNQSLPQAQAMVAETSSGS